MPIRGGLGKNLARLPQAVPDFGVEIVEMILGEENSVTVQAVLVGPCPRRPGRCEERRS